jgi:pimeloyl-ACP methyl ester carboxylesterase
MPQVRLRDFTMHYEERGIGPEPVVFVHGFISTRSWWQPALARLPEDRYHAYALDLRACGDSEQIETGHTLAQYAEDLHQFVDALGLARCTLVGHSMGGGVAMRYAVEHGESLDALVLVDPLAPYGTRFTPDITAWLNAQQGDSEGIRALTLGAFVTPPAGDYLERLIDGGVAWGRAIYLGTMDDMARFDVTDRLGVIAAPTLVTWGDKDTVIPFEAIVKTFTSIPGCALEVWHGVGHSGPIEIPDRFVELLTRFIAEAATVRAAAPVSGAQQ